MKLHIAAQSGPVILSYSTHIGPLKVCVCVCVQASTVAANPACGLNRANKCIILDHRQLDVRDRTHLFRVRVVEDSCYEY